MDGHGIERAQRKLQAARARLILDRPFLGALLLHLPMRIASECPSIGTDGRIIFFNPGFIEGLSLRQAQFMLAHQALHCALSHFARRGHRMRRRWDIACDLVVNQLLVDDGFELPAGMFCDTRHRGLSAEEVYPLVSDDDSRLPMDVHLFGAMGGSDEGHRREQPGARDASRREGDASQEANGFASDDDGWSDAASHDRRHESAGADTQSATIDLDDLSHQWQLRLAAAAQQAQLSGLLGASWQRVIGQLIQPALPWYAVLARHVASRSIDDYSFQRPSRREGPAILPRLNAEQLELFIAIDTSGSVSEAQLDAFVAHVDAIKGQVRARVTVLACDDRLADESAWTFEAWEPVRLPPVLRGGAGTDFRPVFDWIRDRMLRPDVLVYFTDAQGDFPEHVPPFPVVWVVKGPEPVPWGERIQLN